MTNISRYASLVDPPSVPWATRSQKKLPPEKALQHSNELNLCSSGTRG